VSVLEPELLIPLMRDLGSDLGSLLVSLLLFLVVLYYSCTLRYDPSYFCYCNFVSGDKAHLALFAERKFYIQKCDTSKDKYREPK
jgi:hypothetical protein